MNLLKNRLSLVSGPWLMTWPWPGHGQWWDGAGSPRQPVNQATVEIRLWGKVTSRKEHWMENCWGMQGNCLIAEVSLEMLN